MKKTLLVSVFIASAIPVTASADNHSHHGMMAVSDEVITAQRAALVKNTKGKGFGPQSPRDLDTLTGNNMRAFEAAPPHTEMNLCNIHFHKNAEHKGGEFTTYAGNGDGKGFHTGYKYSGTLTTAESQPLEQDICPSKHGALMVGDTIELHYVHSTAQVEPGPTLGACLGEATMNPQLRVETQVFVLVNDKSAADFRKLTKHKKVDGYHQAVNIPTDTGFPIKYDGSTTGPSYNEKGSPLQVSWSVRPKVKKVDARTVAKWCQGNAFDEDHAHGVRNLVINPDLISNIGE